MWTHMALVKARTLQRSFTNSDWAFLQETYDQHANELRMHLRLLLHVMFSSSWTIFDVSLRGERKQLSQTPSCDVRSRTRTGPSFVCTVTVSSARRNNHLPSTTTHMYEIPAQNHGTQTHKQRQSSQPVVSHLPQGWKEPGNMCTSVRFLWSTQPNTIEAGMQCARSFDTSGMNENMNNKTWTTADKPKE